VIIPSHYAPILHALIPCRIKVMLRNGVHRARFAERKKCRRLAHQNAGLLSLTQPPRTGPSFLIAPRCCPSQSHGYRPSGRISFASMAVRHHRLNRISILHWDMSLPRCTRHQNADGILSTMTGSARGMMRYPNIINLSPAIVLKALGHATDGACLPRRNVARGRG